MHLRIRLGHFQGSSCLYSYSIRGRYCLPVTEVTLPLPPTPSRVAVLFTCNAGLRTKQILKFSHHGEPAQPPSFSQTESAGTASPQTAAGTFPSVDLSPTLFAWRAPAVEKRSPSRIGPVLHKRIWPPVLQHVWTPSCTRFVWTPLHQPEARPRLRLRVLQHGRSRPTVSQATVQGGEDLCGLPETKHTVSCDVHTFPARQSGRAPGIWPAPRLQWFPFHRQHLLASCPVLASSLWSEEAAGRSEGASC